MGDYDPDAVTFEDEDEVAQPEHPPSKEQLVLLIDCQPDMRKAFQAGGEELSYLQLALRNAREIMEARIIQHPNDDVAVVLYNTRSKLNASEFGGVYLLQGLEALDALRIEQMEQLDDVKFDAEIGSAAPAPESPAQGLMYALWMTQQIYTDKKSKSSKLLILFTNDENPAGTSVLAKAHKEVVVARAQSLAALHARLQLFPLAALHRAWDYRVFWRDLVLLLRAEDSDNAPELETEGADPAAPGSSSQAPAAAAGGSNGNQSHSALGNGAGSDSLPSLPAAAYGSSSQAGGLLAAASQPVGSLQGTQAAGRGQLQAQPVEDDKDLLQLAAPVDPAADPADRMALVYGMFKHQLQYKLSRKRASGRTRWELVPGVCISMRAYTLVSDAGKQARQLARYLHAVNNKPLQASTALVSADTGEVLQQAPTKRVFATKSHQERLPGMVIDVADVKKLKAPLPQGMTLLGFKPRACLAPWHQIMHSTFWRPYDGDIRGSSQVFMALFDALLAYDRMAVCTFVRGKSSPPLMVAMLPQQEVVDELGQQLEPPGMHMIVLPYADDLRRPEVEMAPPAPPRATAEQVSAAEALIAAASLDRGEAGGWTSSCIANPATARHYQVMQALALGRPVPPLSEFEDGTLPDAELLEAPEVVQALQAFKSACGLPAPGSVLPGGKRKAEPGSTPPALKRQAAAQAAGDEYGKIDWEAEVRNGTLGSLTIDHLKLYLRTHGLTLGGNKNTLLDRIQVHMAEEGGQAVMAEQ